jgi:predicted RNase H-like HicB family nuclease
MGGDKGDLISRLNLSISTLSLYKEESLNMTIEVRVPVTFQVDEATGLHVGCAPAIRVFSQGTDLEDVKAALTEALTMFLGHCFKQGILDKVLTECGFKLSKIAASEAAGDEHLTVPLYLVAAAKAGALACQP